MPDRLPFSRADRWIYGLIAAYVLFLLFFGQRFHAMVGFHTADHDAYYESAESLRDGGLPRDPLRPLLYPLLAAVAGSLLDNTFIGARTVTTLLTGLFLWAAYRIGREAFGTGVAVAALLATMLNYFVMTLGVVASTDVPGAAFTLTTLAMAVAAWRRPSTRATLEVAAGFALSFFTRYTALSVLPSAVYAVARPGRPARSAARRVLVFCAAAVLFLTPHFVLNTMAFGHPLHQENLRTTLAKVRGLDVDSGSAMGEMYHHTMSMPYEEVGPQLTENLGGVARGTTWALHHLLRFQLANLLGQDGHSLISYLLLALWATGIVHGLFSPDRRHRILLVFFAVHCLLIAVFGFPWPRLLLPILPLGFLFAFRLLQGVLPESLGVSRLRVPAFATVAGALLLGLGMQSALRLPEFARDHPWGARELALELEQTHGSEVTVLTNVPSLRYSVDYEVIEVWGPEDRIQDLDGFVCFGLARHAAREMLRQGELVEPLAGGFDYLIFGRRTGRGASSWPGLSVPPRSVEPVDRNDDAVLFRVHRSLFRKVASTAEIVGSWSSAFGHRDLEIRPVGPGSVRAPGRHREFEFDLRLDDTVAAQSPCRTPESYEKWLEVAEERPCLLALTLTKDCRDFGVLPASPS